MAAKKRGGRKPAPRKKTGANTSGGGNRVYNLLLFLAIFAVVVGGSLYLSTMGTDGTAASKEKSVGDKTADLLAKMGKMVREATEGETPEPAKPAPKPKEPEPPVYIDEEVEAAEEIPLPQPVKTDKPLLAIIIDDVSTKQQVEALRSLGFPVTMAFFPPTKAFPDTPKLAAGVEYYIIHLPLEAEHHDRPQEKTLKVTDSEEEIKAFIGKIRHDFPRAVAVNNHTGSKFTADEDAMYRLYGALDHYGFTFIDSRTTAKTKAPKVAELFGKKLVAKDFFIDNKADEAYIRERLATAVKRAKKRGYAVVIGHPRPVTIEALRHSKEVLKDVELVYVHRFL